MILNFRIQFIVFLSIICLQIGSAQVVKGKVYDRATNELILFANLTFTDSLNTKFTCITDLDGAYNLDLLKSGIYKVECTYAGLIPKILSIEVGINGIITLDIYLDEDLNLFISTGCLSSC